MSQKKILIIDDEKDFCTLVRKNLEQTGGFQVDMAVTAPDGLSMAKEIKPDLVLLDIMMPDMEGTELAAKLKADPTTADIPIIFLTAAAQKGDISSGEIEISGYPFLAKPVTTEQIIASINEALA